MMLNGKKIQGCRWWCSGKSQWWLTGSRVKGYSKIPSRITKKIDDLSGEELDIEDAKDKWSGLKSSRGNSNPISKSNSMSLYVKFG
jgi:hypothetical protein